MTAFSLLIDVEADAAGGDEQQDKCADCPEALSADEGSLLVLPLAVAATDPPSTCFADSSDSSRMPVNLRIFFCGSKSTQT